jgi:hypothetical protein
MRTAGDEMIAITNAPGKQGAHDINVSYFVRTNVKPETIMGLTSHLTQAYT